MISLQISSVSSWFTDPWTVTNLVQLSNPAKGWVFSGMPSCAQKPRVVCAEGRFRKGVRFGVEFRWVVGGGFSCRKWGKIQGGDRKKEPAGRCTRVCQNCSLANRPLVSSSCVIPGYEFFLSHHKAAAAAQARFLQTVITRSSLVQVSAVVFFSTFLLSEKRLIC